MHIVARYLATGEGNVKRLQDIEPPGLRLRVGDYRLRFHDLGDSILVLAVKHRREASADLPCRNDVIDTRV
jgi:mRNA-degrading endonuclease RelE of RelBE toxin-antitoxin system